MERLLISRMELAVRSKVILKEVPGSQWSIDKYSNIKSSMGGPKTLLHMDPRSPVDAAVYRAYVGSVLEGIASYLS